LPLNYTVKTRARLQLAQTGTKLHSKDTRARLQLAQTANKLNYTVKTHARAYN